MKSVTLKKINLENYKSFSCSLPGKKIFRVNLVKEQRFPGDKNTWEKEKI